MTREVDDMAVSGCSRWRFRCSCCGLRVRRTWGMWGALWTGHRWDCRRAGEPPDA